MCLVPLGLGCGLEEIKGRFRSGAGGSAKSYRLETTTVLYVGMGRDGATAGLYWDHHHPGTYF